MAANPGCALQITAHAPPRPQLPVLPPARAAGALDRGGRVAVALPGRLRHDRSERDRDRRTGPGPLRRGAHRGRARADRRASPRVRRPPPRAARTARRAPGRARRRRHARLRPAAPEDFTVAPAPHALQDRRVEITGPTSRKMVINALNSGARGFMADFEDANSPTWSNMVGGQVNLADAIRGEIEHEEGASTTSWATTPPCCSCARAGLHLPERHLRVDGAAGGRRVHGLRPVRPPQRAGAARSRRRALLLPAQARVAPGGARCGATPS